MSDPFRMTGRVVIVTGGNRGVGKVIARGFLEEGANVVTCSRGEYPDPPASEGLPAEAAGRVVHVPCDVRDPVATQLVVDTARERWGSLDILINNAGGAPPTETAAASPRFHRAVVEINLTAPLVVAVQANRIMQDQPGGGSIVNISSMASVLPSPSLVAYGAAKAGLNHLTRSLAVEWGPKVRVNCIALGTIMTEALREHILPSDPTARERMVRSIPLERIGEPEEIAQTCLFLCSDRATYINGATIWADGGGARPGAGRTDRGGGADRADGLEPGGEA